MVNTTTTTAKIDPALAAPKHYVDITFDAPANTAYHLWVRLKAANTNDDSVHVQFSDSVDANGAAIYRWGTSNSAEVVLAEMDGGTISGWGWADQGWNGLGDPIYFASSGTHTLRIQQREDGPRFDQVVLSPDTYFTVAPGPQKNDNTKLPANPVVSPPPPDTTAPLVAISSPADGSTVSGTTTLSATSSDNVGVVGVQFKLDGVNVGAEDTSTPYSAPWNTTTVSNGAHVLTAVARDAAGNTKTSVPVNVTVSNSTTPPPSGTIVLHAIDVPVANIVGNWAKLSDTSAADNIALVNTTTTAAKIDPALAAPNHYVDITFDAPAGTAYHLWVRLKAANTNDDSIHVQFSDSVDANGAGDLQVGYEQLGGGRPGGNGRRHDLRLGVGRPGMERAGRPDLLRDLRAPYAAHPAARGRPEARSDRALAGHLLHGCAWTAEERHDDPAEVSSEKAPGSRSGPGRSAESREGLRPGPTSAATALRVERWPP